MSEFVERMIDERIRELKREMDDKLKKFVAQLKGKIKIIVPTDVPRILAEGGIVETAEVNLPYSEAYLGLQMGDTKVFYDREKDCPMFIDSGKYRVTLILERLADADHTKGADVTVNRA